MGISKGLLQLLLVFGGALLFAAIGGATVFGLMIVGLSNQRTNSSDFNGFGIGLALMGGIGIGLLVGFFVGIPICAALARGPNLTWLAAVLAVVGYGIAAYGLVWYRGMIRHSEQSMVKAKAAQEAQKQRMDRETKEYLNHANRDVPGLFGDLVYPGSTITPEGYDEPSYPRVVLATQDRFDLVRNYYKDKLTEIVDDKYHLRGKVVRPGDGMKLYMSVEKSSTGTVSITMVLEPGQPNSIGNPQSPDSRQTPPDQAAPQEQSAASALENDPTWVPTSSVAEITTEYGALVYPSSRTSYPSVNHPHPEVKAQMAIMATADSFDVVSSYYRSRLEIKVDQPDKLIGTAARVDGRITFVSVERRNPYTYVTLSAASENGG